MLLLKKILAPVLPICICPKEISFFSSLVNEEGKFILWFFNLFMLHVFATWHLDIIYIFFCILKLLIVIGSKDEVCHSFGALVCPRLCALKVKKKKKKKKKKSPS